MDAEHGGGDPRQPAVHRAAGVEQVANRLRPGRPVRHGAGSPAGAAVEPARRVGDLRPPRPPGDRQRGRLHRRPGCQRSARPSGPGRAPVPAGRAAALRHLRAAAGIRLVQRSARLPVPTRPHQRHPPRIPGGRRTSRSALLTTGTPVSVVITQLAFVTSAQSTLRAGGRPLSVPAECIVTPQAPPGRVPEPPGGGLNRTDLELGCESSRTLSVAHAETEPRRQGDSESRDAGRPGRCRAPAHHARPRGPAQRGSVCGTARAGRARVGLRRVPPRPQRAWIVVEVLCALVVRTHLGGI